MNHIVHKIVAPHPQQNTHSQVSLTTSRWSNHLLQALPLVIHLSQGPFMLSFHSLCQQFHPPVTNSTQTGISISTSTFRIRSNSQAISISQLFLSLITGHFHIPFESTSSLPDSFSLPRFTSCPHNFVYNFLKVIPHSLTPSSVDCPFLLPSLVLP